MRNELERAIRELEAKLPELRRLLAQSEAQLAVSPTAAALAPILLRLLQTTDETTSELRRALLGDVPEVGPVAAPQTSDDTTEGPGYSEAAQELDALLSEIEKGSAFTEADAELAALEEKLGREDSSSPAAEGERPFREIGSAWNPTTFADVERLFGEALTKAVDFYLEDSQETQIVVRNTWEQAERVWNASEGEANPLEVLARLAAFQVGFLLPRPEGKPERREPTERQLFLHLELFRLERLIAEKREQIARRKAAAREANTDDSESITALESELREMLADLMNRSLRLDEEDNGSAGGPIGVLPVTPPPTRGPGAERTFVEALEQELVLARA